MTRDEHLLGYALAHCVALVVHVLNRGNGWFDASPADEPNTYRSGGWYPADMENR